MSIFKTIICNLVAFFILGKKVVVAQGLQYERGTYICAKSKTSIVVKNELQLEVTNTTNRNEPSEELIVIFDGEEVSSVSSKFNIEKIDNYGGIFLGEKKKAKRVLGHYLLFEYPYLYYSPLKSLEGIMDHMVSGAVCLNKDYQGEFKDHKVGWLNLYFEHLRYDEIYYLNFSSNKKIYEDDLEFIFKNSHGEIDVDLNIKTHALTAVKAKILKNGKYIEIPVIDQSFYNSIKHKSSSEKVRLINTTISDYEEFLIVYRLNPGRKRVVNKIFGAEILGQVMSFEIVHI